MSLNTFFLCEPLGLSHWQRLLSQKQMNSCFKKKDPSIFYFPLCIFKLLHSSTLVPCSVFGPLVISALTDNCCGVRASCLLRAWAIRTLGLSYTEMSPLTSLQNRDGFSKGSTGDFSRNQRQNAATEMHFWSPRKLKTELGRAVTLFGTPSSVVHFGLCSVSSLKSIKLKFNEQFQVKFSGLQLCTTLCYRWINSFRK